MVNQNLPGVVSRGIYFHIRFSWHRDIHRTDLGLIIYARRGIAAGYGWFDLEPMPDQFLLNTGEPVLSFHVNGPFMDEPDQLRAADNVLARWEADLRAGLPLAFDRGELFLEEGGTRNYVVVPDMREVEYY
ncbi:hypothetical protein N7466_011549 [Penicillium verhagenii]|uniref:uncharacterized protein n=1 Tax=Penicillium verhagenii TaxID=1562060 RepID=UPI0025453D32|nr:uncharacterized protein N7466_011549 [Penicillium verhagenii]KAJ5915616.1 hypothetical protein N7466_011549 [Penicillium verhagenii]